ncbi:MAG: hypothetical protein Q8R12_02345 [bacterium]|nr:hypothetical protein [bacterium]
MKKFSEARAFGFVLLSLVALFLSAALITNATSIGNNVSVTGTFDATGASTLSSTLTVTGATGIGTTSPAQRFSVHGNALISGNLTSVANVTATGTLNVTGLTTLGNATNTQLTVTSNSYLSTTGIGTTSPSQLFAVHGNALISGNLTSVANITATGTLNVTGLTTLVSATTTHVGVTGTASTTNLVVGGGGSTIAGINFGFCNISSGTIAASSTVATNCTSATGVAANDRVFVMATSSLPTNFIILSASSSAATVISLYIRNMDGPPAVTTTGNISLNFFSFR